MIIIGTLSVWSRTLSFCYAQVGLPGLNKMFSLLQKPKQLFSTDHGNISLIFLTFLSLVWETRSPWCTRISHLQYPQYMCLFLPCMAISHYTFHSHFTLYDPHDPMCCYIASIFKWYIRKNSIVPNKRK